MITTLILSILTILMGDISAKFLAEHQPAKLAAAEWHFETKKGAPLVLFGKLDKETNEVTYAIKIPKALSILATNNPSGTVVGLDSIPKNLWPPLYIHYLFDTKVSIGFYLLFITALFVFLSIWKRGNPFHPFVLIGIVLAAPLSFLAMELGWVFAEVGRLPWIITGVMKVGEAATTAANVKVMYFLFTGLYIVLAVVAVTVLIRLFKGKPAEAELASREES
jgi:cytochrome d ubiquinol oxidase subunit I